MLDKPSLTLKRRLEAPPSQVYSAWTDPKKIARWFGPRDTAQASVAAEIDLRVGGHYRISFTSEGGEQHQVGGVYREVVPNRRLVFSWAWHSTPERASLVSITLAPDGETGTLLPCSTNSSSTRRPATVTSVAGRVRSRNSTSIFPDGKKRPACQQHAPTREARDAQTPGR